MKLNYTISFNNYTNNYVDIVLSISDINISNDKLLLCLPTWTPGSYLIREYAKNIDQVVLLEDDNKTVLQKQNKNSWIIPINNKNEITIAYAVYCFEWGVRNNFINDELIFLTGAATFFYVKGNENLPIEIIIEVPKNYTKIATSLKKVAGNEWHRKADNYDELVDSPIEIGNQENLYFTVDDVPHQVSVFGESNMQKETFIKDLEKIIAVENEIFTSNPCDNYLFIIHHSATNYGGLEHKYCSVNNVPRNNYSKDKYGQTMSLLAHEYFHLWNVKRIKPSSFIPYDYTNEMYTDLLWFFEGVTSYYDDLICYRAGIHTQEEYLKIVANNLNVVINTPGNNIQTLAEASFDTWIKYYRKNENTNNTQISYYTKGAVVVMLFDFITMIATGGERNFDFVLRSLYNDYLKDKNKGITEADITNTLSNIAGIDFATYIQKYIHQTGFNDFEKYFEQIGLTLNTITDSKPTLGISIKNEFNKTTITQKNSIYNQSNGFLNVNDEIIAIDGVALNNNLSDIIQSKYINQKINILVNRDGLLKTYDTTISASKKISYQIAIKNNLNDLQKKLLSIWLKQKHFNS
ncbi:MAG: M61 family metallopeptidase [Chitinophagales bacterium]|nr:M61 family metallopeptidase [Chitinophagales bacterium]